MFKSRKMTEAWYATHTGYRKIQPTVMKTLTVHMRVCLFVCVQTQSQCTERIMLNRLLVFKSRCGVAAALER